MKHHKYNHIDIDGNLVLSNTKHYFEKLKEDGSRESVVILGDELKNIEGKSGATKEYEYMYPEGKVFNAFGDAYYDKPFIRDMKSLIARELYGKSYQKFLEAFKKASIIEFNTARGHTRESLKNFKQLLFDAVPHLHEEFRVSMNMKYKREFSLESAFELYHDTCYDYAMHSDEFVGNYLGGKFIAVQDAKVVAMKNRLLRTRKEVPSSDLVSQGFSDDDKGNIEAMARYFNEIKYQNDFSNMHFVTYRTPVDGPVEKVVHTNKDIIIDSLK